MDYKALYDKRVKAEKLRAYTTIATGVLGAVASVLVLRQLRNERAEASDVLDEGLSQRIGEFLAKTRPE